MTSEPKNLGELEEIWKNQAKNVWKELEEIRAKEIMNATAEDADERRGEIMRMGDLFIKYPVLKKKFDEYIKLVNPEENTVFCGAFYPADECINCREKDAKSTRNCLFKEELKEE